MTSRSNTRDRRPHFRKRNAQAAAHRISLLAVLLAGIALLVADSALAQAKACSGREGVVPGSGCVALTKAVAAQVALNELPLAIDPRLQKGAKRQRFVTMNRDFIDGLRSAAENAEPALLEIFDDVSGQVVFDDSDDLDADGSRRVLYGRIADQPGSRVLLAVRNGIVSARIETSDGRSFTISPAGSGIHRIAEVDASELTCGTHPGGEISELAADPTPAPPLSESLAELEADVAAYDTGSVIDVLVAYSPAARDDLGGTSGIENQIDLVIAATNQAYSDSGVTQRLNLVHTALVSYQEHAAAGESTMGTALDDATDGNVPNLHALRDQYAADMVSFWVDAPPPADATSWTCGIAGLAGYDAGVASMAPYAFSVVNSYCSDPGHTFAHELGHNQGGWHDPDTLMMQTGWTWQEFVSFANSLPDYVSFGYCDPSGDFSTIMAYPHGCNPQAYPSIMRFSHPGLTYGGETTGDSWSDVHSTLNATYSDAVNWRDRADDDDDDTGVTELQNGVPVHNQSVAWHQSRHFRLEVPSSASQVTFETSGGSGDADLYVKFGSQPTTSSFECRSWEWSNNEICTINAPSTGTYYVTLYGYGAASGITVVGTHNGNGPIPMCSTLDDPLCGGIWTGYAFNRGSAKGLGRLNWAEFAVVTTTPNSFSYSDSGGLTLSGPIRRDGRRLSASFSSSSYAALENYLAEMILTEMTLAGNNPGWVDVTIDRSSLRMKPRLKVGKRGGASSLGLSWSLNAVIQTGIGSTTGKVSSKLTLYE